MSSLSLPSLQKCSTFSHGMEEARTRKPHQPPATGTGASWQSPHAQQKPPPPRAQRDQRLGDSAVAIHTILLTWSVLLPYFYGEFL